jgi:ribA/ribD-fused uncharacterized protein
MINRFVGRYKFLSNFYVHPVYFDGELYASSEHAYQAQKVIGPLHKLEVRTAITPAEAKRISNKVPRRENWDEIKLFIMFKVLQAKFAHPALRTLLLATRGHELVEGNRWGDTYWGVNLVTGNGENHLGKLLMQVRAEL